MQILAACNRTSRERTRTARAKSVQFVPGMSCGEVKESPGETAISTGAFGKTTHGTADSESTRNRSRSAMSKWAQTAHKKAAKVLGYALTLGTADAWAMAATVWASRLSDEERAALAWAAPRSLTPDHAQAVSDAVLGAQEAS